MKFETGKTYVDREGGHYIYVGPNPCAKDRPTVAGAAIFVRPGSGAVCTRNADGTSRSGVSLFDIIAEKKAKVTRYVNVYQYSTGAATFGAIYDTKEEAAEAAENNGVQSGVRARLATVTWEE